MIKNMIKVATIAVGSLLGSCDSNSFHRAEQYMTNKAQKELIDVVGPKYNEKYSGSTIEYVTAQSKLDSVAHRDVFIGTHAANDSAKVAEFNKIAKKGRITDIYKAEEKLISTNVKTGAFKDILKKAENSRYYEYIQYATDSINYRNFFEKHNLLDGKTVSRLNKICKQIKPL